jgi:hypothetical protein
MDLKFLAKFRTEFFMQLDKVISREMNSEGAFQRTEENPETTVVASMPDAWVFENRLPDFMIKAGFFLAPVAEEGRGIRFRKQDGMAAAFEKVTQTECGHCVRAGSYFELHLRHPVEMMIESKRGIGSEKADAVGARDPLKCEANGRFRIPFHANLELISIQGAAVFRERTPWIISHQQRDFALDLGRRGDA